MKLPKQFEIRSKQWSLEYKWRLTYNREHVLGLCDYKTRTIYLDRSMDADTKLATFLHEWLHAVLYEYGLGMNSEQEPIGREQEENIVHAIETELPLMFKLKLA